MLTEPSEISTVVLEERVPESYTDNYKNAEFSLFLAESAQHQSIHYEI